MSDSATPLDYGLRQSTWAVEAARVLKVMRAAGPPLLFGLRLWASVCLALYVAFWLELDNPYWAGTSAAIVCQPQLGASLRKGWYRMIGTCVGAVVSIVLVACFPHDRVLFLGGLALWGAVCAFVATILRNFASYSAALAGYTVAIVAGDLLGATGGVDANAAFLLAVARASEIIIGIACAGVILAGTDLGGARRWLAAQLADLSSGITAGFTDNLAQAGPDVPDTQPVRREFIRRVVALDPVIDQTLGESSQLRYNSPVLQSAVDGLFAALSGWRAVANHLLRVSKNEAAAVLGNVPQELQSARLPDASARWIGDTLALRRLCELTVQRLVGLQATTPSLRLLADKAAETFTGIAHALNGLALLAGHGAQPVQRRISKQIRVADWLPAFVNGGRAFVVIGAVALFWVVSAWPSGSGTITFATIVVLLLGPRADEAYGAALVFTVGSVLSLALAAIVKFAVLPGLGTETFSGFSLVLGFCLVPIGALLAAARRPWQLGLVTGLAVQFLPLLAPTNPIAYDPLAFYNFGSAILTGCAVGALSFRLFLPLSPAFRTRRLLALSLRDLRRLARGRGLAHRAGRIEGRLAVMPDEATPDQRAELLAALSVASEITQLRRITSQLGVDANLDAALIAIAEGNCALATARFARLDEVLAVREPGSQAALRARGSILVVSEALKRHGAYFDAGATR
jgi:uncharacterized membrane protein YccC